MGARPHRAPPLSRNGIATLASVAEVTLAQALEFCERALRIEITLEEAKRLWPEVPTDPYLASVREDLVFGLEHVPASRAHPRGDPDRWRKMPEYDDLSARVTELRSRLANR
jgi:hypothetical protein